MSKGVAKLTTAAAGAIVTTAEAKDHLNESSNAKDTLIDTYISAATEYAQEYTERQFYTATWTYYLDTFPGGCITLPRGPVQSVSSVKYYNTSGQQTWNSSNYDVAIEGDIARIHAVSSWPTTDADVLHAVEVEYVTGYGIASAVPDAIKQAVLLIVGDLYTKREDYKKESSFAHLLLDKYRIYFHD